MRFDRRRFLAASSFCLAAPGLAVAQAATQRRFVFIILRGAADGLNTVVPYADAAYARLRGPLALDAGSLHKLDGSFGLHPALKEVGGLYRNGQALIVHAVASAYRERSHFDGQNVLESGGASPYQLKDGWVNRLANLLPRHASEAVALAPTVPLALRGAAPVVSYAPSAIPDPPEDFMVRVDELYAADPQLHGLWKSVLDAKRLVGAQAQDRQQDSATMGRLAAGFLARSARIAMIESGGWDTHTQQNGRLQAQLARLDALVGALRSGLGQAWSQTVVLVATEFGRTVAANGTGGTDHGTASVAMLLGGAVNGGRVLADWPGLSQLHEGRDLRPTLSLEQLAAGAAAETFHLDGPKVAGVLFPQTSRGTVLQGLVRG